MQRRGKTRQTVMTYVTTLVLLLLGGLILYVATRAPTELIPPEGPEMLAQRQAPDNAYYPLSEIKNLEPPKPETLYIPDEEYPGSPMRYEPEEGSLGRLLGVSRPDSDPLVRAYVFEQADPMFAKLDEAFACSHYHYPELGDMSSERRHLAPMRHIARLHAARARFIIAEEGDADEAFGYVWNTLRLGQTAGGDGALIDYLVGVAIQSIALSELPALARYADSPETLMRAAETLKVFQADMPSLRSSLERELRVAQNTLASGKAYDLMNEGQYGGTDPISKTLRWGEELKIGFMARRSAKFVGKNREVLLEGWTVPFLERQAWMDQHSEVARHIEEDFWFSGLARVQVAEALLHANYRGSLIVLALERHRLALGAYPDSLASLTPRFIAELPQDPFSGKDFVYKRIEDDYLLYSVDHDQKDNGGLNSRHGRDRLIHVPPKWGKEEAEKEPARVGRREPGLAKDAVRKPAPAGRAVGQGARRPKPGARGLGRRSGASRGRGAAGGDS